MHVAVTLRDIMVLLDNVRLGASMPDVGFEDANQTYNSIVTKLNKKVSLKVSDLESALWSCNLLDEKGKFNRLLKISREIVLKGHIRILS